MSLREIEVYDAETRRLAVEGNAVTDLAQINETGPLRRLIEETIAQMLGYSIDDIQRVKGEMGDEADQQAEREAGPAMNGGGGGKPKKKSKKMPPGARKAPDGRHYVPDPNRPGKYLLVAERG